MRNVFAMDKASNVDCRLNIGRLINAIIGIEWHEVMQKIAQ
jgi:hypothetical protein